MSFATTDQTYEDEYEDTHVHQVYEHIAPHFSQTRYKPWPLISEFLLSLSPGSVGLDIGCGNGKYLDINPDIYIIGSDRSSELVQIAQRKKKTRAGDVAIGDILSLPHRLGGFDFAISIAVVHHLSTRERRVQAIRSILDNLSDSEDESKAGRAMIYVWALEQENSRRGWNKEHEQDVMVPWVMKKPKDSTGYVEEKTFKRYYHLYRKGELEEDIGQAEGAVVDSGYEKDNWWAIAKRSAVT